MLERKMYHPRRIQFMNFITKSTWDYYYLYLFLIFMILISTLRDGFVESLGVTAMVPVEYLPREMLVLPLIGMFLSQIIPILGE